MGVIIKHVYQALPSKTCDTILVPFLSFARTADIKYRLPFDKYV